MEQILVCWLAALARSSSEKEDCGYSVCLEDLLHQVLALQTPADIVVGPSRNKVGRLEVQGVDDMFLLSAQSTSRA